MVAHGSSHGPTFSFLYSLLPSFMAPSDPYAEVYGSMNIIDSASTYLQAWALDFSYLGIYFANLLIGIGCGWLVLRSYPRNILILSHLPHVNHSLLFFTDMFFLLSTVIQVFLQAFVQKRCFHSGLQPRISHAEKSLNSIPGNISGPLRATAVIVLYGMTPEESPAFRSLIEARRSKPACAADFPSSCGTTVHRGTSMASSRRRCVLSTTRATSVWPLPTTSA